MKEALITGITGQDGSYLAELLLAKGYTVHGVARLPETPHQFWRIEHILEKIKLIRADYDLIPEIISKIKPDEIYHLAAQSRVDESFRQELSTFNFNIASTESILSAIKVHSPESRFYFAATSEMFGNAPGLPYSERTPFNPLSPYAVSKVAGFHLVKMYREAYGLHAGSGILFNHESPRRGAEYVTRKIAIAVARIKAGEMEKLHLGNLDIRRDWGFSGDYVEAMWLMLQQESADDYVIGTGKSHSLAELLDLAFSHAGLKWQDHVVSDPTFFRPLEAKEVIADPSKAKEKLGWSAKMSFEELIKLMVSTEMNSYGLPR